MAWHSRQYCVIPTDEANIAIVHLLPGASSNSSIATVHRPIELSMRIQKHRSR
jgi:hypothetical protein